MAYTGSEQELVIAGTASGGTMQYALGTDDKTALTSGWGEAIPAKINTGTYYVWYKAKGDTTHTDSKAACVTATIAAKSDYNVKSIQGTEHVLDGNANVVITVRYIRKDSMGFSGTLQ